ncbi:MAG: hypothetical protein M3O26_15695 [Pseudomonadota bacterium]|nr:hypothetical protein [Pseudomonadota bacterium]
MSKVQPASQLGVRLKEAMDRRKIKESELVSALQELARGDEHEDLRSKLSQQMVNYILKGGAARSFYTPFLADALKVPCVWLAFGIGVDPLAKDSPSPTETPDEREQQLLRAFRAAEDPVKRTIEKALSIEPDNKGHSPKKHAASKRPTRRAA